MKPLTYIITVTLTLTLLFGTVLILHQQREINQLKKTNAAYLEAGMKLAEDEIEYKENNQALFAALLDIRNFLDSRGLGRVYEMAKPGTYDRDSKT